MKILAPFSKKEEVEPLIDAGADELYCGIVPAEWRNKYTIFDTLNRRENYGANFSNFKDLQYATQLAHIKNIPVYVTMNGLYCKEQYPLIQKIIKRLKDINVDGLIIADIGLLLMLWKLKIFKEIHMGTGGTAFNSKTVSFYERLGVSRVILPRHLTVNEIKGVSQKNSGQVGLEVFILNTLCPNVDGFCTFYHGLSLIGKEIAPRVDYEKTGKRIKFFYSHDFDYKGHGCGLKFSIQVFNGKGKKIMRRTPPLSKDKKQAKQGYKACGACAIFDFDKIKIRSLKIVERGAPKESKIKDTKFIRGVLDILERKKNLFKKEFIKKTQKLYCDTYQYDRCSGFSCYYPDVHNGR